MKLKLSDYFSLADFLVRARMLVPKRALLGSRLYRVHTRFHPLTRAEPSWNLSLDTLATKICDRQAPNPT